MLLTTGAMALGFIGGEMGFPAMFYLGGAIVLAGLAVFAAFMRTPEKAVRNS